MTCIALFLRYPFYCSCYVLQLLARFIKMAAPTPGSAFGNMKATDGKQLLDALVNMERELL
jgi:hypothetical protein